MDPYSPTTYRSARSRSARVATALDQLYPRLVDLAAETNAVPPGVEWMLDNHFVVRRASREVKTGLGPGFERRLPFDAVGESTGRRIEVVAASILRETDGLLDRTALARRIKRFGDERAATLAELWALPLYLRLLLLEQLAADAPILLERPLDQAVDLRVANGVRSLLTIQKTDWARFFEEVSNVHAILSRDPSGVYPRMDFGTRDRYRRAVEQLARRQRATEASVANRAYDLAFRASDDRGLLRRHVGYYLLDDGRRELGAKHDAQTDRRRLSWAYVGGILGVAAIHLVALIAILNAVGATQSALVIAGVLAVVPVLTIGANLVNWVISLTVGPRPLAKLDFSIGSGVTRANVVPSSCRTLVVVPGLLTDLRDADALLERIEGHFLATRDANIELALLTDFCDADASTLETDDALLERARQGIVALNTRYGHADTQPFHLFHRRRVWSAPQGRWMGWERKRGKLEELNRLLRGSEDTTYVVHEGKAGHFASFRYIITLDADTILPIGAARRLIETLAHPLNVARFDAQDQRVIAGYTVLQPRVDIAPEPNATRFARAFAGDGAFDIYTRAVSDVYQDLFGEGVFVGKGIYDLDAFRASVEGQFPSDRVLSHDLLEGIHGRAGLVTDVVLYEDYPKNYVAYTRRLHRWIRGDWQLLPWIGRQVPTASERRRNRLSMISRWKLLDNLRRSLLIPCLVVFAAFAWAALPGPAWAWTLVIVLVMATPLLTEIGGGVLRLRPGTLRPTATEVVGSLPRATGRWGLALSFMVHEALVCGDAIARAIVRIGVTRRRQLEWMPAAFAGHGTESRLTIARELGPSVVFAVALAGALAWIRPNALFGAMPLVLAWSLAPALVLWSAGRRGARARFRKQPERAVNDQRMRRLARRTWAYFERVVGPEDHWLPPDHLQEDPKNEVAHRTSPTNIGMSLLSTLAAYDLGYFDLLELVIRLRNTLESLGALPRHQGHFYNWFDTTTLEPLEPRYVSAVDSGNLALALLIIEQSCRELNTDARPFEHRFSGLSDSLSVFCEALSEWGPAADPARRLVETMGAKLGDVRSPRDWLRALDALDDRRFVELDRALVGLFEAEQGIQRPVAFEQLRAWARQSHRDVAGLRNELIVQLPWLPLVEDTPGAIPTVLEPALAGLRVELEAVPLLGEAVGVCRRALRQIDAARELAGVPSAWQVWLERLGAGLQTSLEHASALRERLVELAERASSLVTAMDFRFLYDRDRELMFIGYDATAERYDDHHYDLLASEARVASLVAIAKGDVPLRHWAKLGRPIGRFGGSRALLSWGGTMFEFLMASLALDEGEDTLLEVSARAAVGAQIEYGRRRRVPWGVSESGYARLDAHRNYQYRAFGVAETGFRRELERDLVIAPYACVLALHYAPAEVEANLLRVAELGGVGSLGAYEALDFTQERLALGQSHAVVRSYMSHHQGMILVALHGHLRNREIVARAHRHPLVRSVELLLHERAPGRVPIERPQPAEQGPPTRIRIERVHSWPATLGDVEAHVIGNGRYVVVLSSDGAGFSRWRGLALTRPSDDPVLADDGFAVRVRDRDSDESWSFRAGQDELEGQATREVEFAAHGARVAVHARELLAELEVCVPIDSDTELRVVRVTERGGRRRRLLITGFAELALTDSIQFRRHPAFAKLFVASQFTMLPGMDPGMIVCRRRPREPDENAPWFACALVSDSVKLTGYETDRAACLDRLGGSDELRLRALPDVSTPMQAEVDTCAALAGEIELGPNESCELAFVLIAANSRTELMDRAKQLVSMAQIRRILLATEGGARARAEALGEDTETLIRYQRLLSAVLFPRERLRAAAELPIRNQLGQPGLWRYGISGDWPMIVLRVGAVGISTVAELVRAHKHWRARGLAIDLLLLEEEALGYGGDIRQRLTQVLEHEHAPLNASDGGVFVVYAVGLDAPERDLLLSSASLVLDAAVDDLLASLELARITPLPRFEPEGAAPGTAPTPVLERPRDLNLETNFGGGVSGFSADGREYVIHLDPGGSTPAPWINVLANPEFGCIISERGAGYTWAQNAGLNRLSAWSNDAVLDPPSESLYLRDELDGQVWSPAPAPAPAPAAYQVRHGAGYSRFVHHSYGLRQEVEVFVDPERPVKFIRVKLHDCWARRRRLTATLCVEWLLGGQRPADTRLLTTDFEPGDEIALARNPWNPSFATRWAFAAASERLHGMTSSRVEFFGRTRDRSRPSALERIGLSGEVAHGADACTALQVHVDLEPGGQFELHFVLGQAEDRETAVKLAKSCRAKSMVNERREALDRRWDALLNAIEVHTPDPAFDVLNNRWLLYQSIASRLWGRTGFYQSSGGFGFRDQLQDVLALVHAAPELIRAHLLDAARRQYQAGDVQHWWHPPTGQGLRTRCTDDLLWLPLATAAYVEATGDQAVVHERAPFLDQPPLGPEEHERYESVPRWGEDGTLYEHCIRALEFARTSGAHGLPLIGTCDWNDGFSRVGIEGRGESVWLGWFYAAVANDFAALAEQIGEIDDAATLRRSAIDYREPLERAWDGAWYRRAYDDDGNPIGSKSNTACKIDSIAQSWGVISRLAPRHRAHTAMESVWERLVIPERALVCLFTPPFVSDRPTLGYIQAYPPGVRENGGQYTHAAAWVAWAFADLGEHDRAYALWSMIVPTGHTRKPEDVIRYRVEPYVVAADIYSVAPHVGRGGWTWYTGSAAWVYRLAIEQILGIRRVDGHVSLSPMGIPSDWPGFELIVRDRGVEHRIRIERLGPEAELEAELDAELGKATVLVDGVPRALPIVLPSRPVGTVHSLVIAIPRVREQAGHAIAPRQRHG